MKSLELYNLSHKFDLYGEESKGSQTAITDGSSLPATSEAIPAGEKMKHVYMDMSAQDTARRFLEHGHFLLKAELLQQ